MVQRKAATVAIGVADIATLELAMAVRDDRLSAFIEDDVVEADGVIGAICNDISRRDPRSARSESHVDVLGVGLRLRRISGRPEEPRRPSPASESQR